MRRNKKPASPTGDRDIVALVRAIYDEVDARPISRACERRTECCRFHLSGRTPYLTRGEALVAAKAWKATGRRSIAERQGACPFLSEPEGRCLIYRDRPFGCRTHFCAAAGGPFGRSEVVDLIWRLEALDAELGGRGGVSFVPAVLDAWAQL